MFKAILSLFAIVAITQATPLAHAEPVALEVRDNPLAKCLKNPDGANPAPSNPNSYCRQAFTDPGYTYGTQKVPFGQNFVTDVVSPTSGPMHCCSRCENEPQCVGWQM